MPMSKYVYNVCVIISNSVIVAVVIIPLLLRMFSLILMQLF